MADFNNMTDEQLAAIAGVQLPDAAAPPAPAPVAPSTAVVPPTTVAQAILGQESGNNSNVPNSIDGAMGTAQIMPATFAQYAKPGERIDNPADNRAVQQRIIDDYNQKFAGDPARIAVAYFSGPGNVAPADSPTPWKHDRADGNGKTTSAYVGDVLKRIGSSIVPTAEASEGAPAAAPAPVAAAAPAATPQAPAVSPVAQPAAQAPQNDPFASMSDEQLAKIAGVDLPNPVAEHGTAKSYLSGVSDALKSGVLDIGSAFDKSANSPATLNASNEILRQAGNDMENGHFLGASRKVLDAFNQTVRDSGPGRALTGLGKIVSAPVAPILNDVGQVATAAGVPQDLQEGAGNLMMTLGGARMGRGREAAAPVAPAEVPPVGPSAPPPEAPVAPQTPPAAPTSPAAAVPPQVPPAAAPPASAGFPPVNQPQMNGIFPPKVPVPASLLSTDDGKPLIVSPKAQRQGTDITLQAMKDEGIGPQELRDAADKVDASNKEGIPLTAVDALTEEPGSGRNLVQLLSAAANRPGQGAKMAGQLALRGANSAKQIGGILDQAISGEKYYDTQNVVDDTKKASSPIYQQAMAEAKPIDISPVLTNIADQMTTAKGGIKTALQKAQGLLTNDEGKPETTLQTLHNSKLALDDAIDASNKDSSMGRLAKAKLVDVKNQLLQQMDATNPLYQQARQKYADAASVQNALEQGRDFMKMDKEEIGQFMQNEDVSNPEKTAFATGARRAIQDVIDRRREGTNPITALNNSAVKDRVAQLFSDPKAADKFNAALARQQNMHNNNSAMGGSQTASRTEFNKSIEKGGSALGTVVHTAIEPQGALANGVKHVIDKQFETMAKTLSTDKAATIVRLLTTKDPEALRYLAKKMEK